MKTGDQFTWVDNGKLRCGAVTAVFDHDEEYGKPGFFSFERAQFLIEDEGVLWIRGWHGSASEGAKALIAAYKLRPEQRTGANWMKLPDGRYVPIF